MRKGEVTTQGVLISILIVGLFFGVIGAFISMNGVNYDTEGFVEGDIAKYDYSENLSAVISQAEDSIDQVTVDKNLFDYLAGIFNAVLAPFKFIYRTFALLIGLSSDVVEDLNLLPVFSEFLASLITIIVIVGIVLIKFYLGRQK